MKSISEPFGHIISNKKRATCQTNSSVNHIGHLASKYLLYVVLSMRSYGNNFIFSRLGSLYSDCIPIWMAMEAESNEQVL